MISLSGRSYLRSALVSSMYSMLLYTPRLSWQSCMIAPTNSVVTMISAETNGSSIYSMLEGSGRFEGLVSSMTLPSVVWTLYTTPGAVVTRSRLNSLSSLSCMISRWRSPRNPHLKPNPSAIDVSGSKLSAASFSWSFSSASLRSGYFAPSAGYKPQYTIGCAFL